MTLHETLTKLCEADPERAEQWDVHETGTALLQRLTEALNERGWPYMIEFGDVEHRATVRGKAVRDEDEVAALAAAYLAALQEVTQ